VGNAGGRPLRHIAAFSGLFLSAVSAGAIPQTQIVDPRPKSSVVDLTRTLSPADIKAIDELAVRAQAGGELVVVVIDSVSGAVPRNYTTALFNRFGLDKKQRNRGVMLLGRSRTGRPRSWWVTGTRHRSSV